MKKLIVALQVILMIAVGVLFYRSFSGQKQEVVEVPKPTTEVKLPSKLSADDIVVYYDQDIVLEKSSFVQRLQKQAKAEIEHYGQSYEKEERAYAQWANTQQEMNQKGLLSQAEVNKVLMEDQERKVKLQEKGDKAQQAISELEMKLIKKVQDAIKEAVNILNKDKKIKYVLVQTKSAQIFYPTGDAVNVTDEVIKAIDDLNK